MLKLAKPKSGETLFDLGCGDGRLVHIASAEYGLNAIGFEFSPVVYVIAKLVQPFYWLKGSRAQIKFKNFYRADFHNTDIITCYLLPHSMKTVAEKCQKELKKGSRVGS